MFAQWDYDCKGEKKRDDSHEHLERFLRWLGKELKEVNSVDN